MAHVATQHLQLIKNDLAAAFYHSEVTHLLGMYPFGHVLIPSRLKKMTVFVAVTVFVTVDTNVVFVALCGNCNLPSLEAAW